MKSVRTDDSFDLFWQKLNSKASELDISEPELPRCHSLPRRFDDGLSAGEFHDDPKSFYKQQYYKALVSCIGDRFNQPGYRIYTSLQSLLSKACKQENLVSDLDAICEFYRDDFDKELLRAQLQTLGVHYQQVRGQTREDTSPNLSIFDIKVFHMFIKLFWTSVTSSNHRMYALLPRQAYTKSILFYKQHGPGHIAIPATG